MAKNKDDKQVCKDYRAKVKNSLTEENYKMYRVNINAKTRERNKSGMPAARDKIG